MELVIAEKPSVAQSIAAVLGATQRKDGYLEGNDYLVYIIKLSTRKLYDESGQVHYCIDETLRRRLETKLITKILAFEVA